MPGESAQLVRPPARPPSAVPEKSGAECRGQGGRGGGRGGDTVDKAFDLWLRRGLHQLYDNVAQEPLPKELLQLIEADKAARE